MKTRLQHMRSVEEANNRVIDRSAMRPIDPIVIDDVTYDMFEELDEFLRCQNPLHIRRLAAKLEGIISMEDMGVGLSWHIL